MATSFEAGAHLRSFPNDSMTLASHDSYTQANDHKHSVTNKTSTPDDSQRQRAPSNSRAPLSTITAGQRNNADSSMSTQARPNAAKASRLGTGAKPAPFSFDHGDSSLTKSESYDDIPENMYRPEKSDREGWIHRERLAKIESEELQVAGINLATARSRSRDALGERVKQTGVPQNPQSATRSHSIEDTRQKAVPADVEDEGEDDRQNWDFRTLEEIAADQVAGHTYVSPLLRKSGSKIPVMTSSPTPIPAERYERETPMRRKRTMSGTLMPDDSLVVPKSRNGGMDAEAATTGSSNSSPTKNRTKSTAESRPGTSSGIKPGTTARKASAPTKATASSSSSNGKPLTRGNDPDGPRTATNRPEGDPPWLATMYKPDPMLPPDQQIIPTLARKQQQEQWARDGQAPTMYDRHFNPLAVYDGSGVPQEQTRNWQQVNNEAGGEQLTNGVGAWPLRTSSNPGETTSPTKIATSPADNSAAGDYSATPKAAEKQQELSVPSPHIGSSSSDRGSKRLSGVDRNQEAGPVPTSEQQGNGPLSSNNAGLRVTRMQPSTEKDDDTLDKKRGGCCCIVM